MPPALQKPPLADPDASSPRTLILFRTGSDDAAVIARLGRPNLPAASSSSASTGRTTWIIAPSICSRQGSPPDDRRRTPFTDSLPSRTLAILAGAL